MKKEKSAPVEHKADQKNINKKPYQESRVSAKEKEP